MANISNYLERALLDHSLGTSAYAMPTGVYMALYTNDPGDDGSGTEVTGGGYARQVVTFNAAVTDGTDVTTCTNNGDVTFGPATDATWGTVSHIALYDASTGGELLWHGVAPNPKEIGEDDSAIVRDGQLEITMD